MRNEHKIKSHNLIFLCFITTIIILSISFSRYESTVARDSTTRVAIMATDVLVDAQVPIGAYPGSDPIVCPIVITNKDGDRVCEVAQSFSLEIKRSAIENLPLTYALYKDEYCTEILEPDENGIYSEENFKFTADRQQELTVYLKINWPEDKNNESYALEIEHFAIKVLANQMD